MIDHREAGPGRDPGLHGGDHLGVIAGGGKGDGGLLEHGAGAVADVFDGVPHRVIGVGGGDDLIARREGEGAQHRVHRRRRVVDENQVIAIGAEIGGEAGGGGAQMGRKLIGHEAHRLALHAPAPARLGVEHHLRRGAVGAVVEEADVFLDQPFAADRPAEFRHLFPVMLQSAPAPARANKSSPISDLRLSGKLIP